ncbi:MAG: sporulation protein YtfJ [Ruminococcus sp.]|nr:sporulation protein YtfJ [Ruminococcus sp.]
MNEKTKIEALVETALSKVRELAAGETIVGQPIVTADGTTIIPISKISIGFASGGSDLPTKSKDTFGGGSGGGVTITPVAFVAVYQGEVKLLQLTANAPKENAIVDMIPQVIDKVTEFIDKKKGGKDEAEDEDAEL